MSGKLSKINKKLGNTKIRLQALKKIFEIRFATYTTQIIFENLQLKSSKYFSKNPLLSVILN